jgi:hypothetical protein
MNPDQNTILVLAFAAGVLASASTEIVNRATSTKLSVAFLRLITMGFVVALVVTFALLQAAGKGVAWDAVGAQTLAAWFVALGVHDAAGKKS